MWIIESSTVIITIISSSFVERTFSQDYSEQYLIILSTNNQDRKIKNPITSRVPNLRLILVLGSIGRTITFLYLNYSTYISSGVMGHFFPSVLPVHLMHCLMDNARLGRLSSPCVEDTIFDNKLFFSVVILSELK